MSEHHFLIESQDREDFNNTNPSNFRVNLHKELHPQCIELSFLQMPNTFYNITLKNNRMWIDDTLFTVIPGVYTLNDLLQALATSTGLTFAYNDITNQVLISKNVIFAIDFSLPNSINRAIGFKDIFYGGQTSYLSTFGPKIYDCAIFISTNLNQGVITTGQLKNCTFVIPCNVNKSEIIQFYSKSQFSISPKAKEIQYLDFKVLNSRGEELQGLSDWSCMIKLYY